MFEADYLPKWAPLLQALIGLFELPEDDSIPADEHFIDVEDTPGLFVTFNLFNHSFSVNLIFFISGWERMFTRKSGNLDRKKAGKYH